MRDLRAGCRASSTAENRPAELQIEKKINVHILTVETSFFFFFALSGHTLSSRHLLSWQDSKTGFSWISRIVQKIRKDTAISVPCPTPRPPLREVHSDKF